MNERFVDLIASRNSGVRVYTAQPAGRRMGATPACRRQSGIRVESRQATAALQWRMNFASVT